MRVKIFKPGLTLIFLFIFGYTLCGQTVVKEPIKEYRIDPRYAHGGKFSEVFKRINYVPLETTKESIFGVIGKLEVTDKYFVILDKDANKILIFGRDGKYHVRINLPPLLGGSFTIDRAKNEIVVIVPNDNSCEQRRYDFNGKLMAASKVKYCVNNFIVIGSSFITYLEANRPKELSKDTAWSYYLFYSKDLISFPKKAIALSDNDPARNFPIVNYYSNGNFFSNGKDGYCMFTKPFDYTAYELDTNGVQQQYRFIFPREYTWIPDSGYNVNMAREKQKSFKNSISEKTIVSLNDFYKVNDYLLFVASNTEPTKNSLIFNMRKQELISYPRVTSDSLSCFLPIYNAYKNIQACYQDNIYTSFSSLEMFDASSATRNKRPKYSLVLQEYFKNRSKKDNPVIVEIGL
jgi:hypothetical protein